MKCENKIIFYNNQKDAHVFENSRKKTQRISEKKSFLF